MLTSLLVAAALAAEPTDNATSNAEPTVESAAAAESTVERTERSRLHRNGRTTLIVGGVLVASSIPAGAITYGIVAAGCGGSGHPDCMSLLFVPAVTGLVATAGIGTAAVGGTMLLVDRARGPRDVQVSVAPSGLVVSGRF